MGIVGVIVTVAVAAVGTGTSIYMNKRNVERTEAQMKKAENRAIRDTGRRGRTAVSRAMATAAANCTALRIDKWVTEKKIDQFQKTNGEPGYRIATKLAAEKEQERLDGDNYHYGNTVNNNS